MTLFASRSLRRALTFVFLVPTLVASTLLVTSPANAQRIKPNFWGMHVADWQYNAPTVPVGSANFTMSGTYWQTVEADRGNPNWANIDRFVTAAENIHAQPMIVLGKSPRWASTCRGSRNNYSSCMPKVRPWKRYVTKVAKRYGRQLDYQIWPEANIEQNWRKGRRVGSPRQMAKLTMVAARAINKHAGKRAEIVSPAVALRLKGQRKWALSYFKQRVGGKRVHRYIDSIAIDPYPAKKGSPETSYNIMQNIRKDLRRIGVRKPFWNNEINYGVVGGGEKSRVNYRMNKQQAYVIRTYVLSAAAGMKRTYWYSWHSDRDSVAIKMTDGQVNPLPTAKSYEVVHEWLNKTNFRGCDHKKNGLWVCTAVNGRREVRRIYWHPNRRVKVKLPRSRKFLVNQEGRINESPNRRIRVNYKPVMVASRR